VIANAAEEAGIVVHCGNSDHENSLKAIITGLLRHNSTSFLIHLSGTGILSDFRDTKVYCGQLNPKVYSDIESINEITSRPVGSLHRHTDALIQEAAAKHGDKLKTAIACPPDIYGRGHGPGRNQSVYFPEYIKEIMKIGAPFYMNEGTNTRGWVHIDDVIGLYVPLVEAAVAGGGSVTWGKEGYFFCTSQEATQKDTAVATAKILHAKGVLPTAETKQVSEDVIAGSLAERYQSDMGFYLFASNSRSKPDRAAKEFGYKPKAPSLWETLEADLTDALA